MDLLESPNQPDQAKPVLEKQKTGSKVMAENSSVKVSGASPKRRRPSKWGIVALIFSTAILGIIAIISASRLYRLRDEPVAPTAPEETSAQEITPIEIDEDCQLSFSLASPTPTNTVTPTITLTPTLTPTGTITISPSPSPTSTLTPTSTPTNTPTDAPTGTQVPTETPTNTPVPNSTNTPTETPTEATNTPVPTNTSAPISYTSEEPTPVPTRVELPEAGVAFPAQVLTVLGTIVALGGLLLLF